MSAPTPERTALYRLYDVHGDLLYIGISSEPEERWKDHKWVPRHDTWIAKVTRRSVAWHPSRAAALAAEAKAIHAEKPRYNGTHNFPLAPFTPSDWPPVPGRRGKGAALARLICQEIDSGRWVAGMKLPACEVLAQATGMHATTATLAIRALHADGRLKVIKGVGVFVYDGTEIHRPNHQRAR